MDQYRSLESDFASDIIIKCMVHTFTYECISISSADVIEAGVTPMIR